MTLLMWLWLHMETAVTNFPSNASGAPCWPNFQPVMRSTHGSVVWFQQRDWKPQYVSTLIPRRDDPGQWSRTLLAFPPLPPPFIPILINFSPRRHHPVDLFPPAKLKTGTWIKEHLVKKNTQDVWPTGPAYSLGWSVWRGCLGWPCQGAAPGETQEGGVLLFGEGGGISIVIMASIQRPHSDNTQYQSTGFTFYTKRNTHTGCFNTRGFWTSELWFQDKIWNGGRRR